MADLDRLLEDTSRTFALSIPYLPQPTRHEVTVAYLLFRIADTFEDASRWSRGRRTEALAELALLLATPDVRRAEAVAEGWAREVPIQHDGYRDLLRQTPFVLRSFTELDPEGRACIGEHIDRTISRMAAFVERTGPDGELRLRELEDLRAYCYAVAGIVGEMLTELFLRGREPLAEIGPYLRDRAARFGEGLQLVNILKDSAADAREGRVYIPPAVERSEVFDLARRDLVAATQYTLALQEAGAPDGVVAFNALPVGLAWATLEAVEERGPGAKIGRPAVWAIVRRLEKALAEGRPAVRVPAGRAAT